MLAELGWAATIGAMATVLAAVSLIPQVMRTWRTRSAADLSVSWLVIAFASMILWIAYGILVSAWAITVANAITLLLVLILLAMKYRFARSVVRSVPDADDISAVQR
jgi:MtN3 and saliva related transmembrane protein